MKNQITAPWQAVQKAKIVMLDKHREHFIGLYLNTRLRVVKVELISLGTVDACMVHPREVFRSAIVGRSAGLFVSLKEKGGVF